MPKATKTKQLLKILIGAAWLDGVIQTQERQYLRDLAAVYNLETDPELQALLSEVKTATGGALKFLSPLQATGHYGIFPTDRTTALWLGRPKGRGIRPSRD